jgi:hypothetical protein
LQADEIICKQMHTDASKCSRNPIQSEYESNTNASNKTRTKREKFIKPTLEEVKAYCQERGNSINAEHFFAYYEEKNWKGVHDWQKKVHTWETNGINTTSKQTVQATPTSFDTDEAFDKALRRSYGE